MQDLAAPALPHLGSILALAYFLDRILLCHQAPIPCSFCECRTWQRRRRHT